MVWDHIIGHAPQQAMFRRALHRGRLAHAYAFIGSEGIGKKQFARALAQCLFCQNVSDENLDACGTCDSCVQMQAGTHPDLISIGLPEGKRELPISLIAGDRENRGRTGLCHDIAMAPMSAPRRIAIIDDAHTMNEESANALLKTLEEPPARSMLILISPDEELLLSTIRSRCQPVRFSPLTAGQVAQLLGEITATVPEKQLRHVLDMAAGSPDVARRLLEPGLGELWQVVDEHLSATTLRSQVAVRAVTAALESLGTDTAVQRENMHWVISFAVETLRRRLGQTTDVDELDRLGRMLDRCFDASSHLRQSMSVPLCLEALFAELSRRSRQPAY